MPFTGEIDVSQFIANLGTDDHGLRPAGSAYNSAKPDEDTPYRATWGEVDLSTSMTLQPLPRLIWDVNGYYRALGFSWPFTPTRKELRLAYQRLNGQDNEWLTYCFKQLLNKEFRDMYDRRKLGQFVRDKYILEAEMRKLSEVAREVSEEERRLVTVQDLIDEEEKIRSYKEIPGKVENPFLSDWIWGYYLLNSFKSESENLKTWAEYLIKAFTERQYRRKISIGYIGDTDKRFRIIEHDGRVIFFIHEDEDPTPELAETAVSFYSS